MESSENTGRMRRDALGAKRDHCVRTYTYSACTSSRASAGEDARCETVCHSRLGAVRKVVRILYQIEGSLF